MVTIIQDCDGALVKWPRRRRKKGHLIIRGDSGRMRTASGTAFDCGDREGPGRDPPVERAELRMDLLEVAAGARARASARTEGVEDITTQGGPRTRLDRNSPVRFRHINPNKKKIDLVVHHLMTGLIHFESSEYGAARHCFRQVLRIHGCATAAAGPGDIQAISREAENPDATKAREMLARIEEANPRPTRLRPEAPRRKISSSVRREGWGLIREADCDRAVMEVAAPKRAPRTFASSDGATKKVADMCVGNRGPVDRRDSHGSVACLLAVDGTFAMNNPPPSDPDFASVPPSHSAIATPTDIPDVTSVDSDDIVLGTAVSGTDIASGGKSSFTEDK